MQYCLGTSCSLFPSGSYTNESENCSLMLGLKSAPVINSHGTGIEGVGVGINVSKTNRMIYLSLNSQMDQLMQRPSTGTFLQAYCFTSKTKIRIYNHVDQLSSTSEFLIRSIWLQILGNSDYQTFWKFWHAKFFTLPSLGILDHFPSIKTISMFQTC